jgi:hypothetical protein
MLGVPSPSEPDMKQFQEFRKPLHSSMFNSGKYIASDRDCEKIAWYLLYL